MFHSGQIISASELVRNFPKIRRYIQDYEQPILVTQKQGRPLVLIDAESFEELLSFKLQAQGVGYNAIPLRPLLTE